MNVAQKQHGLWFHVLDVLFNIAVIVAIVVGIRTFLVSPFQVEGNSMVDTLQDRQYIIINKLAYHLGDPQRGDVVVFRPPSDESKHYVKRVIGMPGDRVRIRGGYVYVQPKGEEEVKLTEEYLNERNEGKTYQHPPNEPNGAAVEYIIPEGNYFLLGDNRRGSQDSRSFRTSGGEPIPYVPRENINGRVWFVALPLSEIRTLQATDYGL